jgi:hypothetical protein
MQFDLTDFFDTMTTSTGSTTATATTASQVGTLDKTAEDIAKVAGDIPSQPDIPVEEETCDSGHPESYYANLSIWDIRTFDEFIKKVQYFYKKYPLYTIVVAVTHFIVCIIALMLSLECNQYESPVLKIVVAIIAFLFGEVYIVYYAIYHIVIGAKCYLPPVYGNISRYSNIAPMVSASAMK